jgi:hypothetical protein
MDLTEAAAWLNQAQIVESSLLAAAPAEVWGKHREHARRQRRAHAGRPHDVSTRVLGTRPRSARARAPAVPSVLLLFGVLPVDVHTIALASLTPGRGSLESSSSLLHRRWIHERVLEPDSGWARLSDGVYFECRVPGLDVAQRRPRCAPSSLRARARAAAKPHPRSPPTTAVKGGNPRSACLFCTRRARVCAREVTPLRESLDPCVAAASTNMVSGKI